MANNPLSSTDKSEGLRKVDIIWNITLVCPWNCEICCVDAVHVKKENGSIQVRSESLSTLQTLENDTSKGTIFEQAMAERQRQGLELTFEQKLKVIDHVEGFNARLDFSGGDVTVASENLNLLHIAYERLGREHLTLTATGAGLACCKPQDIAPYISELNFTYDNIVSNVDQNRPRGYADGNLKKAAQFVALGAQTRAECPLTIRNIEEKTLRQLYLNLHENNIGKLLLMRLFPVGRGMFRASDTPSIEQYQFAIQILREMEAKYKHPKLKLQCAMRHMDNKELKENPCDMVNESFGLMANGTLLASPWAVNSCGKPLNDAWVLGNLSREPLADILNTPKARELRNRSHENFGQCKIFSYLNSKLANPMDRIFDKTDPLYVSKVKKQHIDAGRQI